MADLPIPAEAIEAAAKAMCEDDGENWSRRESEREEYRSNVRAAFDALEMEVQQMGRVDRADGDTIMVPEYRLVSRYFPVSQ